MVHKRPICRTMARAVLNGGKKKEKKCSGTSFPKKARGHSMCSTMVSGGWRLAVGGSWRLAVGNWRLVAVGGGWRRLVVGDWWLVEVGSGWQLAVDRRWWLAAVGGGWWLAVGGPLGQSLRAVLSKTKKKIWSLKDRPDYRRILTSFQTQLSLNNALNQRLLTSVLYNIWCTKSRGVGIGIEEFTPLV